MKFVYNRTIFELREIGTLKNWITGYSFFITTFVISGIAAILIMVTSFIVLFFSEQIARSLFTLGQITALVNIISFLLLRYTEIRLEEKLEILETNKLRIGNKIILGRAKIRINDITDVYIVVPHARVIDLDIQAISYL